MRNTVPVGKSFLCEALVLRTFDVGEADRFCVLLTRERGRITARASGVRKPGSRLGGSILPCRHLALGLREGSGGFFVASASPLEPRLDGLSSLASFCAAQEGVELFLAFVQHEERDDALFDAVLAFLSSCASPSASVMLSFELRLLHLLGFLPAEEHIEELRPLAAGARAFLRAAREGKPVGALAQEERERLQELCASFIADHLSGPLKASTVAATMV
ncbi:MAG: recombination protein O N-terminal domain-containing protein [Candidatus Peribacteraceae bacterium]|nr:recombination protein O N-terminal domain-containing protein [Candidatus Peribacteraceae bacterium]